MDLECTAWPWGNTRKGDISVIWCDNLLRQLACHRHPQVKLLNVRQLSQLGAIGMGIGIEMVNQEALLSG